MKDRERSTWTQMLTFCCTAVFILLLGGIVAYVIQRASTKEGDLCFWMISQMNDMRAG